MLEFNLLATRALSPPSDSQFIDRFRNWNLRPLSFTLQLFIVLNE